MSDTDQITRVKYSQLVQGKFVLWTYYEWGNELHLRMQSRAWLKTCGAMQCSICRIRHCSRVTDMAVRSFALLQLVTRTPLRRRHSCQNNKGADKRKDQSDTLLSLGLLLIAGYFFIMSEKDGRVKGTNWSTTTSCHCKLLYLCCLPKDVHILTLPGVHVLSEEFQ